MLALGHQASKKEKEKARRLQQSWKAFRIMASCCWVLIREKKGGGSRGKRTEKDRKKERNKLRKKGGWVARCQLLKQWNGMSSGGRKKRSFFNHWELVRQTVKS